MANIWFISDTHFFHANILKFTGNNGELIRPGFKDADEMNELMVERWNSVVRNGDKVWHLGDVAFKTTERRHDLNNLLHRLRGNKRMLLGNHDNVEALAQTRAFEKIELWKGFHDQGFTCSHIPLRLDSLRDGTVNVHGHIHQNVMKDRGYVNVCVEVRNYTPVHMDEIIQDVRRAAP